MEQGVAASSHAVRRGEADGGDNGPFEISPVHFDGLDQLVCGVLGSLTALFSIYPRLRISD